MRVPTDASIRQRFLNKFTIDSISGCWLWHAGKNTNGYGLIGAGGKYGGMIKAHRVSYAIHIGDFPDNMDVCHTCDTPACVNPNHLFLGTDKDNMQDCIQKGRFPRPKGRIRWSDDLVRQVRQAYSQGEHCFSVLGRQFGISAGTAQHWVLRTRRADVE